MHQSKNLADSGHAASKMIDRRRSVDRRKVDTGIDESVFSTCGERDDVLLSDMDRVKLLKQFMNRSDLA